MFTPALQFTSASATGVGKSEMRRRNYAEGGAYYTHRELGRLVPFDTHMMGASLSLLLC